ncbi:MAG: NADH-quinone oxidoreductase subunit NuoG [Woeseiaceae bacterium]|nr:NADH-quinone oxidoreductase subunit NuoG [Woeseiaceae bacterium]
MSDDTVTIEVDGKSVEARKGQMLIEVTDRIGAYVPRFCYHEKLSVAANCRMCLVEVEKAPKPMPACATPVGDGMKVFTRSAYAMAAQKATMEFLLINHPLDCPICDQGGECELQDLAMGYGRDVSRYNDGKRVVKDKDLGPLVSTDMTRCIHCTRCVRFSQEIEGLQELGTIGRAENMKISMYIEKAVDHELSANIIDLCPVGALNNKPYRYSARAWEMLRHFAVSPHDCVGSNMFAHVLRGRVKRIVPQQNEAINETWIADRDRFSYEGIYSDQRLTRPRMKVDGEWRNVDWEAALGKLATVIGESDGSKVGILASPGATLEEHHLLARIADALGTANIDHRLRQRDFTDQENDPVLPLLGCDIADLDSRDAILVIGSNLRKEVPIIAHRVRKAALAGASVSFVSGSRHTYHFPVAEYLEDSALVRQLAGIAVAAAGNRKLPTPVRALCKGVSATDAQKKIAESLASGKSGHVLLGHIAGRHPAFSALRALGAAIAELTGSGFGRLTEGPNSAGACLAGVQPHRVQGGTARRDAGLTGPEMLDADLDALLLFGVDPDRDLVVDEAEYKLREQNFVAAFTSYDSDALRETADLLLPIGTFAESAGTYVNCEGRWQSFAGISNPVGESRPGWKVLRVLGNHLEIDGFDFESSPEVRDELKAAIGESATVVQYPGTDELPAVDDDAIRDEALDVPMYDVDPLVRRAAALQLTPEARRGRGEGSDQ